MEALDLERKTLGRMVGDLVLSDGNSLKMRGPRVYKRPIRRGKALSIIHESVDLCRFYIFNSDTSPAEKRSWIKVMNGLLSTSVAANRDTDLDQLLERIESLEREVKK